MRTHLLRRPMWACCRPAMWLAASCWFSVSLAFPQQTPSEMNSTNLYAMVGSNGVLILQDPTADEMQDIGRTVYVCGFMYASIGMLWWLATWAPKDSPRTLQMQVTLHCLTWTSTSVGMQMLNKSLVTWLEAPALISAAQMAVTGIVISGLTFNRLLKSDKKQLLLWMIVPLLFSALISSSFYAFEYVSLSLLTVVRNLSPIVVIPIEMMVMPPSKQPRISSIIIISILMMIVGVVVYRQGVVEFSVVGVLFAVGNMMLSVISTVTQRRLLVAECKDLSSGVVTLVTNAIGAIPCLALAALTGEVEAIPEHLDTWSKPEVLVVLFMSGIVGLGIGYLGFETQRVISASSFMVLQGVAKTSVIALGIVMFGDPCGPIPLLGIVLSLLGSLIYGQAQATTKDEEEKIPLLSNPKSVDEGPTGDAILPNEDPTRTEAA